MRRSHSSSSIPLPMSLQHRNDSRNRERTRSAVRNSRDPSLEGHHTPVVLNRLLPGGTDRKYSTQKNQLRTPTTPSSFAGFKRSSSLSSYGSRVSVARCKSPGDKKTLQKQISDKKWVLEKYSKLQEFIQTSGLFNPELAEKIRPPTLAIFIEIISVLFKQIIKTIPINLQNYGDVVIQTLKLLRYPGQITPSTLKTVNTMHLGWPHFIAMTSWLIDRVDLASIHNGFREQQDEDVKLTFSMYDAVFEFLTTHHYIISNSENTPDQESLIDSEDKLYLEMLRITGSNQKDALKISERLETERAEVAKIESQLNENKAENEKIRVQNLERQNVINKYENSKGTQEQEIKEEIVQLKKTVSKHVEIKAALAVSIKDLEDCISKQSCKLKEKTEILYQIEDLKRVIERKDRKLTEYRVVRDDLDLELKTLVTEIESKVDNWNVSVTKTFLPEMKELKLREKGFHTTEFIQEIIQTHKEKMELQEKLLKECKSIQSDIEKLKKQKESLTESNKAMDSTRRDLNDLRNSIELLETQNKEILSDLDECKTNHQIKIKEIKELEESKSKEEECVIAKLNNRKEELIKKTDLAAKKGILGIAEAYNMAIENIQKTEEMMHLMLRDAKVNLKASTQNVQQSFDYLLSLQDTTKKLHQISDEKNK